MKKDSGSQRHNVHHAQRNMLQNSWCILWSQHSRAKSLDHGWICRPSVFSLSALLRSLCYSAKQALYCGLFIPHPFSTRAPRPRPLPIGMPMPWPTNCKFWLFWSHWIQQIVWVYINILNIEIIQFYWLVSNCQIVCRVPSLCLFLSVPLEASHSALVEHIHRIHKHHPFSSNLAHNKSNW